MITTFELIEDFLIATRGHNYKDMRLQTYELLAHDGQIRVTFNYNPESPHLDVSSQIEYLGFLDYLTFIYNQK